MTFELIDWIIIGLFLAISLFISLRYQGEASKSLSDFFLGGRNLPWYIAGVSMVATTFAADTPLAVTELVAKNGISSNWIWWSFLFGGMLTTFFFANLWRRANVLTELELIELRYSGKPAAILRGFKAIYLGLFMNVIVIGWVNVAMVSIIQVFFDIPKETAFWYMMAVMVITMIYASLSGLIGVAITDTIQFAIAITGCIVLAVIVVNSDEVGGIDGLKEKLPEGALNFFPTIGDSPKGTFSNLSISVGAFLSYIGVQWWSSWYPGAEPGGGGYIAQRMMSAKDEKNAVFATLFFQAAHYCLRPWPWILVGLCALTLYAPKTHYPDSIIYSKIELLKDGVHSIADQNKLLESLPELSSAFNNSKKNEILTDGVSSLEDLYLLYPDFETELKKNPKMKRSIEYGIDTKVGFVHAMKDYLPAGLKGLLFVAFLAAYMSTISTQLNWGASYLVNDLYKRFIEKKNKLTEEEQNKKNIIVSRLFTVAIMIIGGFVTTQIDSISAVWTFVMSCGAGLGLVLILRWYWWRINAWSEITATIAPFIAYYISSQYLENKFGQGFMDNNGTFFITVGFTTVAWLIATVLTKPSGKEHLIKFYQLVKPEGLWNPIRIAAREEKRTSQLLHLTACWISAISFVYSLLFATGKTIFKEWGEALIWGAICLVSIWLLQHFIKRTNIMN